MSSFEIFLIISMCAVPIVALFLVLPKKLKKKDKKEKPKTKTYEELKKEETPVVKVEPKTNSQRPLEAVAITDDDFKGYLKEKQKNITKPKRAEFPKDFIDRTEDYFPRRRRTRGAQTPKTVAQEIKSLSPELKALILTGALDKKDFDNI